MAAMVNPEPHSAQAEVLDFMGTLACAVFCKKISGSDQIFRCDSLLLVRMIIPKKKSA